MGRWNKKTRSWGEGGLKKAGLYPNENELALASQEVGK